MPRPIYIIDTPGPTLEQAIAWSSHLTPEDVAELRAFANKRRLEKEHAMARAAKKPKRVRKTLRTA